MSLTLILDKSSFQSLNYAELHRLSCYYKHIITPVLTLEILGDLSKENKAGHSPSEERVKDFARKLFPGETIINLDYRKVVLLDLLHQRIPHDRMPIVGVETTSVINGQKGFKVEESEEEKSIYKWKEGYFSEADKELSKKWRRQTTEAEILDRLKSRMHLKAKNLSNAEELNEFVEEHLNNPSFQDTLLLIIYQNYDINAGKAVEINQKWISEGKPPIKEFAPYAYHCLKIDTLFLFGLQENLISTRSTNIVDMEYFYYLPFTKVFSSNDIVHKFLVPVLIKEDQRFIEGTALKEDIKHLVKTIKELPLEDQKKYYLKPPIVQESFTFQLWKEFYGYTVNDHLWNHKPTTKEKERAKRKFEELHTAFEQNIEHGVDIENADFIIRQTNIGKNDPCPCGSGKKLIECHTTEDEFDKEVFIQKLEDIKSGKIELDIPINKDYLDQCIGNLKSGKLPFEKIKALQK